MTQTETFFSRVGAILRQKSLPIGLLVVCGELAIWSSGKASLGTVLLLPALAALGAGVGAVVRALSDDEKNK
jgi:hypothetical protein